MNSRKTVNRNTRKPKSKRKNTKTSKYVERTNRSRIVTTVPNVVAFPDKYKTKLRYVDNLQISGAAQQYTFRANSLFDPDFTSTGHQPFYYDQLIAVYEKYRVYETSIKLTIINSASSPAFAVCIPTSQIPTITSLSQAEELADAITAGPIPTNNFKTVILRKSMTTKEVLGLTGGQIYDDTWAAVFNANPIDLWYYALYFSPASSSLNLTLRVELHFSCEFYDRAPVSLSFEQIDSMRKPKISKQI